MPERLTREQARALRRLRAESDMAGRRPGEFEAIGGAVMEAEVDNLPMDEETMPHKLVTQASL